MAEVTIKGVHPLADLFPMMSDAELRVLAADIKANGQQEKGKVGRDDSLLRDGRNRQAACKIAGVEFEYELVDGNAGDMIVSENIMRRHLTKGQIAILAVVAELGIELPADSAPGGQRQSAPGAQSPNRQYDYRSQAHRRVQDLVSRRVLDEAILIVDWAPDQARLILDTGQGWREGRETAIERKQSANSEAHRREILAEEEPELLAQVSEKGGITIEEAWRLRESRLRQERETRVRLTGYLVDYVGTKVGKNDPTELVTNYDPEFASPKITLARLDEAIEYLKAIRAEFKRQKKEEE